MAELHILPVPNAPKCIAEIGSPLSPKETEQRRRMVMELEAVLLEAKAGKIDGVTIGIDYVEGGSKVVVEAAFLMRQLAINARAALIINDRITNELS